jgi:D-amino-acid dehydrogenase
MHVAIVGAGLAGVCTAYELVLRGHSVTVFERRASVAAEASFAWPGIACAAAWPGSLPEATTRSRRSLVHGAPRLGAAWARIDVRWMLQRLAVTSTSRRAARDAALATMASDGLRRLAQIDAALALEHAQVSGLLVLTPPVRRPPAAPDARLSPEALRAIEPALSEAAALGGAVLVTDAIAGNARQFTQQLRRHAQQLGVRFELSTTVERLWAGQPPRLRCADGRELTFDIVVVCAGSGAPDLLSRSGLRLPLTVLHHYAITAPLAQAEDALPEGPRSAVFDAISGLSVVGLGSRLRVGGLVEIGGRAERSAPAALRRLHAHLDRLFPGAAVSRAAQHWRGARVHTGDGLPRVGPGPWPGIWLNLGHGGINWALPLGAAVALASSLDRESDRPGAAAGPAGHRTDGFADTEPSAAASGAAHHRVDASD